MDEAVEEEAVELAKEFLSLFLLGRFQFKLKMLSLTFLVSTE